MLFAQKIKQLWEIQHLPQRQIVPVLDIDTATYCKIEKGSIVVDPWRTYKAGSGVKVIHYGNTRGQLL